MLQTEEKTQNGTKIQTGESVCEEGKPESEETATRFSDLAAAATSGQEKNPLSL